MKQIDLTYRQAQVALAYLAASPYLLSIHTINDAIKQSCESARAALAVRIQEAFGQRVTLVQTQYGSTLVGEVSCIDALHEAAIRVLAHDKVDALLADKEDALAAARGAPERAQRPKYRFVDTPAVKPPSRPAPVLVSVAKRHNVSLPKLSFLSVEGQ